MHKPIIRPEQPGDAGAISRVTELAFRSAPHADGTEHWVVEALRAAGQLSVSLVAEMDGNLVGHVAVSPVTIADGAAGWFGLGPISVLPEWQNRRIGTSLMNGALAELRDRGAGGCVVLGEPAYYARFGFRAESTLRFPGVPPEYFMAVVFDGHLPSGTVSYHDAFRATSQTP